MNTAPALANGIATLAFVAGGLCVAVPPLRKFALRLLAVGVVIAGAAAVIPENLDGSLSGELSLISACLAVTGLISALFGRYRLAAYLSTPFLLLWLFIAAVVPLLAPMKTLAARYWWIVALLVSAPLLAKFVVGRFVALARAYGQGHRSSLALGRIIDRLFGPYRHRHRRDRHISDSARASQRKSTRTL